MKSCSSPRRGRKLPTTKCFLPLLPERATALRLLEFWSRQPGSERYDPTRFFPVTTGRAPRRQIASGPPGPCPGAAPTGGRCDRRERNRRPLRRTRPTSRHAGRPTILRPGDSWCGPARDSQRSWEKDRRRAWWLPQQSPKMRSTRARPTLRATTVTAGN